MVKQLYKNASDGEMSQSLSPEKNTPTIDKVMDMSEFKVGMSESMFNTIMNHNNTILELPRQPLPSAVLRNSAAINV